MDLYRKVAPTTSCITVAQVRANQRATATTEDELIALWIKAAEGMIERSTNRSIMRQTYVLRAPSLLPTITLPRPAMNDAPVSGIVAKHINFETAVETLFADNVIRQRQVSMLPTLTFTNVVRADRAGEMSIQYETGALMATEVPSDVQQAVLFLASHFYRNREAVVTDPRRGTGVELPYGVESLIGGYRIPNVGTDPNAYNDLTWEPF